MFAFQRSHFRLGIAGLAFLILAVGICTAEPQDQAAPANKSEAPQSTNAAVDEFAAMVKQRVQDWQPTKDERLLDQVGWASDLIEAKRLAKKHQRPLFVFTYSGSTTRANAIALQRC